MGTTTAQNNASQSGTGANPPTAQQVKICSGKKDVVTKKDSELLFNLATKEFVIVPPSQTAALDNEVKCFDAFKPYMDAFLPDKVHNEKEHAAYMKAVLFYIEKFVKTTNDKEANDILADLPQSIPKKKDELLKKENNFVPCALKSGEIVQYLRIRENRTVSLRSSKNKPFTKTYKLDTDDLNLELKKRKERAENKEETPKPISERIKETNSVIRKAINKAQKLETAESKLFEEVLWDRGGQVYELVNKNFFEDINQLDAGVSAQVLRAASDAKYGSTVDLKNLKVKISGKAEGSLSAFESKARLKIYLPDFDGFDLIAHLRKIDPRLVHADAKPIRLMLQMALQGSAFVGVCASIGLEAGASLKSKTMKSNEGKFEASLELFAGAKASAEVSVSANMKLINDEKTPQQTLSWELLGSITYGGYVAIGLGIDASFRIGYWDSRLRMAAKIGVVFKAGAGTHICVAIDPLNIGRLVYTVAVSLDFRGMSDVLDEKVHSLYQSIMLNCFYTGQTIKEVVELMYSDMERVLESTSLLAETTLSVFKSVDDTFDDYIPGYSGFKKSNSAFWLLKEAYYSLQRSNAKSMLRNAAIKMVNEATRDNRWRYATWQIKSNLIADMCTGSGGWIEFAEEDKENAIIQVVRTFRHLNEANKIEIGLSHRGKIIANELDGPQLSEYQTIRSRLK
jgi:hypothetical protein